MLSTSRCRTRPATAASASFQRYIATRQAEMPRASRLLVLQLRISSRFFASDLPQAAMASEARATTTTTLRRGAAFEAFDGEAEPEDRRVEVALQLVVELARLGDVGQQLERVAEVLLGRLLAVARELDASLADQAAVPAHAPFDGHEHDALSPVDPPAPWGRPSLDR